MAKISTKRVALEEGDVNQLLEFTVFYNSEIGFYAGIPSELGPNFDQLTEKEMKTYHAQRKYKRKYGRDNDEHQRTVVAKTEDELVKAMKVLALYLVKMSLEKIPVIIVEFENHGDEADRYYGVKPKRHKRHQYEDDDHEADEKDLTGLPTVGLEFSAIYCVKVSTGSGKDRFYKYHEYGKGDEKEITREEVHRNSWRDRELMIPDTPENRQFIEELHRALHMLTQKMKDFTASPEDMMKVIETRQKLLNFTETPAT